MCDNRITVRDISSENMRMRRMGALPVLYFPHFEETGLVRQAFSTRAGGVSSGYLSELNFSVKMGDTPENVSKNYDRMAEALGITKDRFVHTAQTHTTNLRVITGADAGMGVTGERTYDNIDGIMTDVPGLVLVASFADCIPLFFLDPVRRCVALSHSGWRGTLGRIGEKTVRKMGEVYGSDSSDLLVGIGPGICSDCYEVSAEVAEQFFAAFGGESDAFLREGKAEHYQLDLPKACETILLQAGILPEHLKTAGICTCCNHDMLFSHRYTKGKRGNLGAFLGLL